MRSVQPRLVALWRRPLLRIVLIGLASGTAFTIGAIGELGTAYLPLLDPASIFLLLAFFGGTASVLFQMLSAVVSITRVIGEYLGVNQKARKWTIWVLRALFIVGVVTAILVQRALSTRPPGNAAGWLDNTFADDVLVGTMAILAGILALSFRDSIVRRFPRGEVFLVQVGVTSLSVGALVTSLFLGSFYMDYLRKRDPTVQIHLNDGEPLNSATIAALGADGLLVFVGRDREAIYLPHSQIRSVQSLADRLSYPR
jgi:hypothetical protein